MSGLLYLLLPAFFVAIGFAMTYFREAPYERMRRRLGIRRKTKKGSFSFERLFTTQRKLTFYTMGAVTVGVYVAVAMLHATPFIGVIIGGILPWIAMTVYKERWLDRYEEGVVQAIEYGSGLFETGATVEQWVKEVVHEIEGPVVREFEKGASQVKQNLPVVDWMEYTAETTPSRYFSYVLNGMLANYEKANALNEFMREVLDEVNHKRRYERTMRLERDEAMKLLGAMTLPPIAMYAMFFGPVNAYLAQNWLQNVIFGVGLAGYVAILLFAWRTASAKPKI